MLLILGMECLGIPFVPLFNWVPAQGDEDSPGVLAAGLDVASHGTTSITLAGRGVLASLNDDGPG